MSATVVTCYYKIKSKRSHETYMEWIKNFMSMEMKTVIFTDSGSINDLQTLYPPCETRRYIIKPIDKFITSVFEWETDLEMDHEKESHSIDLYKLWNEKIFFVMEAIQNNFYNTNKFAWIDIGSFRDVSILPQVTGFPSESKFVNGKVTFLQIQRFQMSEVQNLQTIDNRFQYVDRIGGTMFAGDIESLKKFTMIHFSTLKEFKEKKVFAGKDQTLYAFEALRFPDVIELVRNNYSTEYDPWFYLHLHWSPNILKLVFIGPGIMPIPPTGWGAVEILIWDMRCELVKQGHLVQIINTQNMIEAEQAIKFLKPDFVHIQYDNYPHLASKISSYIKAIAITSHYGYIDQLNKWDTYGSGYSYMNTFKNCLNHSSDSNVYHFALSESIKKVYIKLGVDQNKIRVTPNGANEEKFVYKENPSYPERSLCLGKIERRKGQYLLQNIDHVWFAGNRYDQTFDYSNPRYLGEWNKDTLYTSLSDYGNLILISDGEADPLVVKEALICGLGVVLSEYACANLDLDKEFITVIPNDKINDLTYLSKEIEKNREYSVSHRDEIREYSKKFFWSNIMKDYTEMVKNIITSI